MIDGSFRKRLWDKYGNTTTMKDKVTVKANKNLHMNCFGEMNKKSGKIKKFWRNYSRECESRTHFQIG